MISSEDKGYLISWALRDSSWGFLSPPCWPSHKGTQDKKHQPQSLGGGDRGGTLLNESSTQ